MKIRIEGLSEVRDALASLPNATQKSIMRRILVMRAKRIQQAAKALVPHDSGFLGESIRVQAKTGGAAGKAAFAAAMASGAGKSMARAAARAANAQTAGQVEVFIGPNAGPREIAAEFGTKYRSPQPFMRPAWDANKTATLQDIAADMWTEIRKAVERRAKRAAKKAGL